MQPTGPAWTTNLFAYVDNNPVARIDPSGKQGEAAELEEDLEELGPPGQEAALALLAAYALWEGTENLANGAANAADDLWNWMYAKVKSRGVGPSGRPKIHNIDLPTKKAAADAARNAGVGAPIKHPNPKRGKPHFHPVDINGKKIQDGTHYNYPP